MKLGDFRVSFVDFARLLHCRPAQLRSCCSPIFPRSGLQSCAQLGIGAPLQSGLFSGLAYLAFLLAFRTWIWSRKCISWFGVSTKPWLGKRLRCVAPHSVIELRLMLATGVPGCICAPPPFAPFNTVTKEVQLCLAEKTRRSFHCRTYEAPCPTQFLLHSEVMFCGCVGTVVSVAASALTIQFPDTDDISLPFQGVATQTQTDCRPQGSYRSPFGLLAANLG